MTDKVYLAYEDWGYDGIHIIGVFVDLEGALTAFPESEYHYPPKEGKNNWPGDNWKQWTMPKKGLEDCQGAVVMEMPVEVRRVRSE